MASRLVPQLGSDRTSARPRQAGTVFAGRCILWFIDNTTSLYSFVNGTANDPQIDRAVAVLYVCDAHYSFLTWFEFVNSKANWADGISRLHADDPFARQHGFPIVQVKVPQGMWFHDIARVWDVVQR